MHVCRVCGMGKPRKSFGKHGGAKCRTCKSRAVPIEKKREMKRSWLERNRERCRITRSIYDCAHREENRPKRAAYARLYSKRTRLYINLRKRLLKARLSEHGAHGRELKELFASYLNRCVHCFEILTVQTIDHIVPLAGGGGSEIENLAPCCHRCNSSKGRKPLIIWMATRF